MVASSRFFFQLKDGEQLYDSSLPGQAACTACANSRAKPRSGVPVSHQQEVGTGYFDDVTTVIQGGSSSVKALTGSTEEEQFH